MILITSQSPAAFAGACIDEDEDGYYVDPSPSYCADEYYLDCDDTNPDMYPGHGCVFPVREAVEEIEDEINDLIHSGEFDINSGQTNSLLNKLLKAAETVEDDKIHVAINMFNSFINQINAYINSGAISQDNGDGLIFAVQDIIALID